MFWWKISNMVKKKIFDLLNPVKNKREIKNMLQIKKRGSISWKKECYLSLANWYMRRRRANGKHMYMRRSSCCTSIYPSANISTLTLYGPFCIRGTYHLRVRNPRNRSVSRNNTRCHGQPSTFPHTNDDGPSKLLTRWFFQWTKKDIKTKNFLNGMQHKPRKFLS